MLRARLCDRASEAIAPTGRRLDDAFDTTEVGAHQMHTPARRVRLESYTRNDDGRIRWIGKATVGRERGSDVGLVGESAGADHEVDRVRLLQPALEEEDETGGGPQGLRLQPGTADSEMSEATGA